MFDQGCDYIIDLLLTITYEIQLSKMKQPFKIQNQELTRESQIIQNCVRYNLHLIQIKYIMKSSLDKYTKVGSLSLHMQRYQLSPKYNQQQSKISQVESQQITMPPIRMQNRQSKLSVTSQPKQKTKRQSSEKYQKSSTIKFSNENTSVQNHVEDEDQIFNQCLNFTSKVETLKKQKLQNAIQQFQQQERKKMEYLLQKQKKVTNFKYNQKRNQLKVSYEKESNKLTKAIEEINKLKSAYPKIFQDLSDRRNNLNKQYQVSLQKIRQTKQKLISEWKRSSNEQILKKTNKQF